MRSLTMSVLGVALLGLGLAEREVIQPKGDAAGDAARRGIQWLVSVQGQDGGWGQDGGETSYVRQGERLESSGNDAANTAVAVLALLRAGHTPSRGDHRESVRRGVEFLLRSVEKSPAEGLAVTSVTGTQIQRKLGPYIDTFLTSMVLAELDGQMGEGRGNGRVRRALQKCVAKIEKNQQQDGSWNLAGGWAPILGTSMASRSLDVARQKGVPVNSAVVARVDEYTKRAAMAGGVAGGVPGGRAAGLGAAAGVPLYQGAQALEQMSRTPADRKRNERDIKAITKQLASPRFVSGFGSMGGEEFFSYLNISDSLRRSGGEEWRDWNSRIRSRLVSLQNQDGTWAGHHCITGRVAVTSAAILTLLAERQPAPEPAVVPARSRQ